MSKQRYIVEARRPHGFHTYSKSLHVLNADTQARTYERAKKMADLAARRGYDVRVTHFEYLPAELKQRLIYEVYALVALPWKGAK